MSNFSIAISGLNVAQRAFELIGNNMANAATEGYHRQKIELTPAYTSQAGGFMLGGGVEIGDVTRIVDSLLEAEIDRQNSLLSQTEQECATLQTIENMPPMKDIKNAYEKEHEIHEEEQKRKII